jgi:two-component system cell cycle sensor histidine kinase/response regulator CckA
MSSALEKDSGSARPLEGVRALVVEDNAALRTAIRRFLEAAGCAVLEAGAPSEAIGVATAHDGPIHVALVDLILPEMSGPECADLLKESRPDLAVAYMSGYAESVSEGYPEDDTPVLLAKPFAREELVSTILSLLGRDGPAAS